MAPSSSCTGLWGMGRTGSEPAGSPRGLGHIPTSYPPQEKQDPLSHFHMDTLLMTTHNLLFGGSETVGTTLRHAFLALMKYPKVQGASAGSLVGRPAHTAR